MSAPRYCWFTVIYPTHCPLLQERLAQQLGSQPAGAIVALHATLPPYLASAKALHRPPHDPLAAAERTLAFLQARITNWLYYYFT
jgi:hypothetical protein